MTFGLYIGLEKYSCDMCSPGPKPTHTVIHQDSSKVDICPTCYRKCLDHPKFQEGIKDRTIKVIER